MNYQLCMTHDLTTANRHDHAWTDKWAQNISTLSRPMSLIRLCDEHWQSRSEGHLYGTKGTWKNYPTCFALLDVGIMTILRRTDNYILIWPRNPVSLNSITVIFQNCPSSQTELLRSLAFAAMFVLRNDAVKLYGRFHPAPNLYEGDLLSGSWTPWVSRVERVQGFLRGSRFQRSNKQKALTTFQRFQGARSLT